MAGNANGVAGSSINSLDSNWGISISSDGTLYITDYNNHRIVVVTLSGTRSVSAFGSGPGSSSNQLKYPNDVFVTDTAVYVMDTGNSRVQKWSRNGTNPMTRPGASSLGTCYYLFIDKYDDLYVSINTDNKVIRFTANSSVYTTVAGTGTTGSTSYQFNSPSGMWVDGARTLYVADFNNHRIQKWIYNASSGITVAGTGGSGSSLTQLQNPESVAVDTSGRVYIADRYNHRIVRWAPNATVGVCVVACTGVAGQQANQLNEPISVAFDTNGSMYVSDSSNNRVQKFQVFDNASECSNLAG